MQHQRHKCYAELEWLRHLIRGAASLQLKFCVARYRPCSQ
jgi:hypothetical protein